MKDYEGIVENIMKEYVKISGNMKEICQNSRKYEGICEEYEEIYQKYEGICGKYKGICQNM